MGAMGTFYWRKIKRARQPCEKADLVTHPMRGYSTTHLFLGTRQQILRVHSEPQTGKMGDAYLAMHQP